MTLNIIIAKEGAKAQTKATKEAEIRKKKARLTAYNKRRDELKTQKLKREGATLQKQVDKMSDNKMATVLANPNEFSKEEVKIAKAKLSLEKVRADKGPKSKSQVRELTAGSDSKTGATRGFGMAYGGMSGGKRHMYVAGGSVKDNPGLAALGKASPKAFKNITGKDPSGN